MTDEVSIRTDDLDEKAKSRIRDALNAAGLKMKEAAGTGTKVIPAETGTIETTIHLDTANMDDDAIERLRAQGFSSERHSRILESVLKGALEGYGMKGDQELFLQWVWCQWLKYAARQNEGPREEFKKRYEIRPGESLRQAAQTSGGW